MGYRDTYLDDEAAAKDLLGYQQYVKAISGVLLNDDVKTPFSIGIYGKWGSGKSSLMRLIKGRIDTKGKINNIYASWFCPWQFHEQPNLLLPLLLTLKSDAQAFNSIKGALKAIKSEAGKIAEVTSEACLSIITDPLIELSRIEAIGEKYEKRTDVFASGKFQDIEFSRRLKEKFEELVEILVGKNGKLVVFIDDLDRCKPDKVVEMLESIKFFIGVKRCIFIIGMNYDVVSHSIRSTYYSPISPKRRASEFDVDDYLEKIIHLPFRIPALQVKSVQKFIERVEPNKDISELSELFAKFLPKNPRKIKKALNIYRLTLSLAKGSKLIPKGDKKIKEKSELLAKILILRERWPKVYFKFEESTKILKERRPLDKIKENLTAVDKYEIEQLISFGGSKFDTYKDLDQFFSLSETTAGPQGDEGEVKEYSQGQSSSGASESGKGSQENKSDEDGGGKCSGASVTQS